MKSILTVIMIFTSINFFGQNVSISDINYVKKNYDFYGSVACVGSTALVKAQCYTRNNFCYVIIYFKRDDYDGSGVPYLYCNIPVQRWSNFKSDGITGYWGNSFRQYIEPYTCENSNNNPDYTIQQPKPLMNSELVENTLNTLQNNYNYNIQVIFKAEKSCFDLIYSQCKKYNKSDVDLNRIHKRFVNEYVIPIIFSI